MKRNGQVTKNNIRTNRINILDIFILQYTQYKDEFTKTPSNQITKYDFICPNSFVRIKSQKGIRKTKEYIDYVY